MIEAFVNAPPPALNLSPLGHGPNDPCFKRHGRNVWRAINTASGSATVRYAPVVGGVSVTAWGQGASEALQIAPATLGVGDSMASFSSNENALVESLMRRYDDLRYPSTESVFEAIVPFVIEQRVTSADAHRAWRMLVTNWGEPAPGPGDLIVPPDAATVAAKRYFDFHRFGIERVRAETIRALASRSARVEQAATLSGDQRRERLEAFSGVGKWTSAHVASVAWGDADAVPVGDFHIPGIVVHALTGIRGGDDDAMMQLLDPFRPHRGRVARWLVLAGLGPSPRAPRQKVPDIRGI